jgi:hypothetical protein
MQASQLFGANFCTTSGLLTATGAETVHDTTVTICYCVDGRAKTKTAITDGATPTTDAVTGSTFTPLTANKGCIFVWCLNASGTVKVVQGPIADMSGGEFIVYPQFPNIPEDLTPFAYTVDEAGSTAGTITFGSSNWNATGRTVTHVNVFVLPRRPQNS